MKKIDFVNFLSSSAKARKPSAIRALQPLLKTPGLISLGGGFPASSLFPFSSFTAKLTDGTSITLEGPDLDVALQYSPSYGLDEFVSVLKELQTRIHKPVYDDWHVIVTTGSQDALTKSFSMLLDDGDTILTENPTYSGALAALHPMGTKIIGITTDHNGIIPEILEETLSNFGKKFPNHKKPKVLYTIPTGQNPAGSSISNERRKIIYNLACQYNLIILEDDPYWFLQLSPYKEGNAGKESEKLQSFFSMDKEQRVIRFDSFSKIISSGIRIGWATGPKGFIENMQLHQQASTLHPSGISQGIVLSLLKKWGHSGFDSHVHKVQEFYTNKRNIFLNLAKKHISGQCDWNVPVAGMFVWLKVHGVEDTVDLIQKEAFKAGVLMLPGRVFSPNGEPSPYVRASYSIVTEDDIDKALERFGGLLRSKKGK